MIEERLLPKWFAQHPWACRALDRATFHLSHLAAGVLSLLIPLSMATPHISGAAAAWAAAATALCGIARLVVWSARPDLADGALRDVVGPRG